MRILQVVFSLAPGGAERFVVELCNELSKQNIVTLLTICDSNLKFNGFYLDDLSPKVNHINLGCKKGINLKVFFSIFQIIKKINPSIINTHLNVLIYIYLPSIINLKKRKFYHTIHTYATKEAGFRWQRIVNVFYYRKNIIRPIAISKIIRKSLCELYGIENAILINNGRSKMHKTDEFEKIYNEVENCKLHQDDLVFVSIARFCEVKNQKMLVNVFNRLIQQGFHVILIFIGAGFDSTEGTELKSKAAKGIYFLGTRSNIVDYLLSSNAFCLSSIWEGLPISLIEALSCGTTPICTPAGGIVDVIIDGINGYLSSDFEEDSYYSTILRYLGNKSKISRADLNSFFEKHYTIEKCAKNYLCEYNKIEPLDID